MTIIIIRYIQCRQKPGSLANIRDVEQTSHVPVFTVNEFIQNRAILMSIGGSGFVPDRLGLLIDQNPVDHSYKIKQQKDDGVREN